MLTVYKAMERLQEMKDHTLKMQKVAYAGTSGSSRKPEDEVIITQRDLTELLADRGELIRIYEQMKVEYPSTK